MRFYSTSFLVLCLYVLLPCACSSPVSQNLLRPSYQPGRARSNRGHNFGHSALFSRTGELHRSLESLIRQGATGLEITGRPTSKFKQLPSGTIGGVKIRLARHHIIPLNRLTEFWNALLKDKVNRKRASPFIKKVFGNLGKYYSSTGPRSELTQLLGSIKPSDILKAQSVVEDWVTNGEDPGTHRREVTRADLKDAWSAAYVWLPGNLFIGPSGEIRSDDPGDLFEDGAALIIDNSGRRMKLSEYKTVFSNMEQYIRKPSGTLLGKILAALEKISAASSPIPFNSKQWKKSGAKYSIRRR